MKIPDDSALRHQDQSLRQSFTSPQRAIYSQRSKMRHLLKKHHLAKKRHLDKIFSSVPFFYFSSPRDAQVKVFFWLSDAFLYYWRIF